MAEFDVKQVSTFQWLGIGAGALAFINSFLPWYSVSYEAGPISESLSLNQWDVAFIGWFPLLLLIGAAVVVALPLFGVNVPNGTMIWAGLAGLATLLTLLRWLTYESGAEAEALGSAGVSAGASFGTIIGLILAVVSLAGAILTWQKASAAKSA